MRKILELRREDFERRYDAFISSHSAFCAELRKLREQGKEIEDEVLVVTAKFYMEG